MEISNDCICIVIMLLAAGLTAVVIWFTMIKPKNGFQENYVHLRRYRPAKDYRHQYFWKRPFLRYPYPFRRPFDYWKPIYYEQQPLEAVSLTEYDIDPATGRCKTIDKLESGVARIPVPRLGSSFSIALDMKFYPGVTDDDKLIFRLGQAYPSPMLVYSPVDNTLAMILYTHFDGYVKKIIYTGKLDTGNWNNIIWVQRGQWLWVYVNGVEKINVNVGSIPKISPGTFYLDSKEFVEYKNVEICDTAWNKKRIDAYLEGKKAMDS